MLFSRVFLGSADCKRGRRKGATSKNVKNRQKASKSFSTLFDNFRAGQKTSKIVKKCQKVFRHFSTIFARHLFSGPFCNPLRFGRGKQFLGVLDGFPWFLPKDQGMEDQGRHIYPDPPFHAFFSQKSVG